MPRVNTIKKDGKTYIKTIQAMYLAGVAVAGGEARRLLSSGKLRLDGDIVTNGDFLIPSGNYVFTIGKQEFPFNIENDT